MVNKLLFIEPEEVINVSNETNIVDVRAFWKYVKGHIPRANWFYIPDLTQHSKGYPSKPKEIDELVKVLGKNGISNEDKVIIAYDRISSSGAAYLYWFLEYLGQEEIMLLKGGMEEWERKNLPLERGVPKPVAKEYKARIRNEIRSNFEEVMKVVEGLDNAFLIDVRKLEEVQGKIKTTPKAGKIPAAYILDPEILVNVLYGDESAMQQLKELALKHNKIITYCTTGERASLAWLILKKMLKHENVKLYPESFYEYSMKENARIEI
ncbi:MAG TPA: rhodanese-like domain-containing protein [Geobacterales bacterium]|nr:rhodanese-like domain-containing protein [Geobacterales bacterium]